MEENTDQDKDRKRLAQSVQFSEQPRTAKLAE